MPLLSRLTMRAFRLMSAVKSRPMPSATMPYSFPCWRSSKRSAVWRSALVGMQPRRRQVPPQPAGSRSTTAVRSPIWAARTAATYPPGPLPITVTSNSPLAKSPPRGRKLLTLPKTRRGDKARRCGGRMIE